jgi:uncharacterized protein (DUF1786 family)
MKILAVDVGTGTQDILLFDTNLDIENSYKLVLPAPTMIINRKIRQATRERRPVLLSGVMMGGGPSQWAAEAHVISGLPLYATPQAARSFNDDPIAVEAMGIHVIAEEEADNLVSNLKEGFEHIILKDFDLSAIQTAFAQFGVSLDDMAAVAVAVFDHGNSPPGTSDRLFRFNYLDQRIRAENRLDAFAYFSDQIPPIMTRLQAVAQSAGNLPCPLIVMDTAPAAVSGASFDPHVSALSRKIIANVGNFHTLAFRLGPGGIEGVFEHHTGLLTQSRLENLLIRLADGTLDHADVFNDHGHGALIYDHHPLFLDPIAGNLIVTGPRRGMLRTSSLQPYFAAPFGDMMITGCFGLLACVADLLPQLREPILAALQNPSGIGRPPWEV